MKFREQKKWNREIYPFKKELQTKSPSQSAPNILVLSGQPDIFSVR